MNQRYAHLMLDFTFKKAFGTPANKPLMLSLLNAFLGSHLKSPIVDITYLRTESAGKTPGSRGTVFDVYCVDQLGNRFLTEVQMEPQTLEPQTFFADRALFYRSRAQSEMAEKGRDWDYQLPALHVLGFLNFALDENVHYSRQVLLMDTETLEPFSDRESFTFVEVPKFSKTLEECSTDAERWIYLFANLHKMEGVPVDFNKTLFQALFDIAEIARFSGDELDTYGESMEFYDDTQNCINYAKQLASEKGRKEGKLEGRADGIAEKTLDAVESLLAEGCEWEFIERVAKITEQEFLVLQQKYPKTSPLDPA